MALSLLGLGFLSHILMDVKTTVAERLCTTTPCIFESPRGVPSNSTILGYWLSRSASSPIDLDKPSAVSGSHARATPRGHLEEQECILLRRDPLQGDSWASLPYIQTGGHSRAFPRENPEPSVAELSGRGTAMVREPRTLTCAVEGTCTTLRAPVPSQDGLVKAPNAAVSSVLRFIPTPRAHGAPFRCHRDFPLDDLARSGQISLRVVSPARLLTAFCSLRRTTRCTCSFHGVPAPSVQWQLRGAPVGSSDRHVVTSSVWGPWVNSSISLVGESPEAVVELRCEGNNLYGTHTSGVFLLPSKKLSVFRRGLLQGAVYGAIAAALLFLCLVLSAMKVLTRWREDGVLKTRGGGSHAKLREPPEPRKPDTPTGLGLG